MSLRSVIEQDDKGVLLAVDNADQPTRMQVAKMAEAIETIVEGEPCNRASEAVLRTAVLMIMLLCKRGHEHVVLQRGAQIMQMLAVRQMLRATAMPDGATLQ